MKWRVIIRPKAEADLREARKWYETQLPGLGEESLDEVRRSLTRLQLDPERHPIYYRGFRRLLTHRFPYKLFNRIEADRIVVFRSLHAKREHQRKLLT